MTASLHGTPREVFTAFLKLGLTSFSGPAAHPGYFRGEFVDRRRWLDDRGYSDLVALCQFFPGWRAARSAWPWAAVQVVLLGALGGAALSAWSA